MTFLDLPWPSMTFYDLLSPLWPSMIIKCLLISPALTSGPLRLQSSPAQINSPSNPRLDPINSKSSYYYYYHYHLIFTLSFVVPVLYKWVISLRENVCMHGSALWICPPWIRVYCIAAFFRLLLVAAVSWLQGLNIGTRYKSIIQFRHWSDFKLNFIKMFYSIISIVQFTKLYSKSLLLRSLMLTLLSFWG